VFEFHYPESLIQKILPAAHFPTAPAFERVEVQVASSSYVGMLIGWSFPTSTTAENTRLNLRGSEVVRACAKDKNGQRCETSTLEGIPGLQQKKGKGRQKAR
jgi:hypothetical protein